MVASPPGVLLVHGARERQLSTGNIRRNQVKKWPNLQVFVEHFLLETSRKLARTNLLRSCSLQTLYTDASPVRSRFVHDEGDRVHESTIVRWWMNFRMTSVPA